MKKEYNNIDVANLKKAKITDVFVLTSKDDVEGTLVPYLKKFSGSGIKVHAWIICFSDNDKFYNPDPKKSPNRIKDLKSSIYSISRNYKVNGIHLDYVRYPGTAYKYNGTIHVTNFVKNIKTYINNVNKEKIPGKPKIRLSAALMPETDKNGYYYGQDYSELAPHLDFLVPMIYRGSYGGRSWIGDTTKYIVKAAKGKPVVAGLVTYQGAKYTPLSANTINLDLTEAMKNGSNGFVLFKFGLTPKNYIPQVVSTPPQATSTPPKTVSTPPQATSTPPKTVSTPPQATSTPPKTVSKPTKTVSKPTKNIPKVISKPPKVYSVAKDVTPPKVKKTKPTKNYKKTSLTTPITITFSENIKSASKYKKIYIKNMNTGKKVAIKISIKGKILSIKMNRSRLHKNTYLVYVPSKAVKDKKGNLLTKTYKFKFKTV